MFWGRRALHAYNRRVARLSIHGDRAWFDPRDFPWTRDVEREWRGIRAELDQVMTRPELIPEFGEISPDQAHFRAYGTWRTFFLYAYGIQVDENCQRCPVTTRVVNRIPRMLTAFFSILEPGMHIPPHRGPYGGLLRYHLALRVPEPVTTCRIRVDDRVATWEEGKSLVFDDTYEHEAWNESPESRVVLFVDFERPLPSALRVMNRLLIRLMRLSPLVRDGRRRYQAWRRRVQEGQTPQPPSAAVR
jgi:beta-hydroxylase